MNCEILLLRKVDDVVILDMIGKMIEEVIDEILVMVN